MKLKLFSVPAVNSRIKSVVGGFSSTLSKTVLSASTVLLSAGAFAQTGTWDTLARNSPNYNQGVMLLLTNGTVMAHNSSGGGVGKGWDLLTPDSKGSYTNGTWSSIASMSYDRLFFPTQVFPDGKVLAAGGEYGAGATHGEVYDPTTNKWTATGAVTGGQNIYDGNSEILPNGQVLVGLQNGSNPSYDDLFYNEGTNAWSTAPIAPLNHDEAAWVKLPDSSILFVGIAGTKSCRYRPQTNSWVSDANCPVSLYDTYGEEAGAAVLLPNGKIIFFGATGHNAVYTPSGTASPGTWVATTDFPKIRGTQVGTVDAPACMMPNGKILCAVSPIGTSPSNEFNAPTYFLEYDYTLDKYIQVTNQVTGWGGDSIPVNCDFTTMLLLPTGQVLLGVNQTGFSQYYWIYTPNGSNLASGKPVLNSVYQKTCGSTYYMTGKLFNGISEGAAFGDDWAMSTNYPLVRFTDGTNVWYATTSNWNRIGAVMTDSLEDSAQFVLPAAMPAGTYTMQVVVNGIPSSDWVFSSYGVTATVVSNVSCKGSSDGKATTTVSGGSSPYTYSWSPSGGTNATASNLSAGTYTVTVKDKLGCTTTASVTITQPATGITVTIGSVVNVKCKGGSTGSAKATASGGTSPYTYSWAPSGGTNATASNLSAGSYTVTVTDTKGCSSTASVTITQPAAGVSVTIGSIVNEKCNGASTGSMKATPAGGTSPYTYSWAPSGGTNATASNLSAGTYTVTVTDAGGCTATAKATITQPTAITATFTITNVKCNGSSTGSIKGTATGGTGTYTYSWAPSGGTNATASNLSAGSYTLTVTDANGCTKTASATVTQPTAITVTFAITNVKCNGSKTGSIKGTATGGTGTYTYSWAPSGGTNATASNLSAGSYTLTVTDANGCTKTASASVTQPTAITVTFAITNVKCNGSSTGSIKGTATGGTGTYTYSWAPSGGTAAKASNLSAGSYTLTVTDANGCTKTASASVTQPTALVATTGSIVNESCNGGTGGSAKVTASGGTAGYSYSWAPSGGTSVTASNLSAGTYTVTVTDANGCTQTAKATITEPPAISITTSATQTACSGSTGTATASPTGGTGSYTYSWAPSGGTGVTASNLSTGTYTVTVTDANGCNATATANVTDAGGETVSITGSTNVSCNGSSTGSISTNTTGGTSPYTYSWTPSGGTNANTTGLSAGAYTVTVTDANGCSSTAMATITEPAALSVTQNYQPTTAQTVCDGSAWVSVSGGTAPYTYKWSPNGATTDSISKLCNGNYCCTITDSNGCSDSVCVSVITGIPVIGNAASVKIFPDPNNGYFTISGLEKGQVVRMYNYIGQQINTTHVNNATMHFNITNNPNGVYLLRITDKDGKLVKEAKLIKTN